MNEMQARLWQRMLIAVDSYDSGSVCFSELVAELEGEIDAGDFGADLVREFYRYWGPLETRNAMRAGRVPRVSAQADVAAMRRFLEEHRPVGDSEEP